MGNPIRYETDFDGNRVNIYVEHSVEKFNGCAVETVPTNDNARVFHSRSSLGEGYCSWNEFDGFRTLNARWGIVELIGKIEGITRISAASQRELLISKAEMFDWEELQPKIISLLEDFNRSSSR